MDLSSITLPIIRHWLCELINYSTHHLALTLWTYHQSNHLPSGTSPVELLPTTLSTIWYWLCVINQLPSIWTWLCGRIINHNYLPSGPDSVDVSSTTVTFHLDLTLWTYHQPQLPSIWTWLCGCIINHSYLPSGPDSVDVPSTTLSAMRHWLWVCFQSHHLSLTLSVNHTTHYVTDFVDVLHYLSFGTGSLPFSIQQQSPSSERTSKKRGVHKKAWYWLWQPFSFYYQLPCVQYKQAPHALSMVVNTETLTLMWTHKTKPYKWTAFLSCI